MKRIIYECTRDSALWVLGKIDNSKIPDFWLFLGRLGSALNDVAYKAYRAQLLSNLDRMKARVAELKEEAGQ